jgi:glycosyltransferase involved in cell wall biosynthesis
VPKFSIITPVYNRAPLLQKMLASVAAQRCRDFELIVVDDGSNDDPARVIRSSGLQVRTLNQANRGPGAARNAGMREAGGDYVAFLDSDDVWFPWTLEVYDEVIGAHDRPSFIAGKPLRFQRESELEAAEEARVVSALFRDYLASGDEWRWWGVSSFVIRRDALQGCGGFSEAHINGEDADLALKLGTARGFVQITRPVTFGYREHDANATGNLDKNLAGLWYKIDRERAGAYPGGASRERERWRILTRHARPMILACPREGRRSEGWKLYRATFRWHVALGRWKFLMAFPLQALLTGARAATLNPNIASA